MNEDYFAEGVMEMPTPCQHCGGIFDLNDGRASEKWYPNTIICESCGDKEDKEIQQDELFEEMTEGVDNAYYDANNLLLQMVEAEFFKGPLDFDREQIVMKWKAEHEKLTNLWHGINSQIQ